MFVGGAHPLGGALAVAPAAHGDRVDVALGVLLPLGRDLFKAVSQALDTALRRLA